MKLLSRSEVAVMRYTDPFTLSENSCMRFSPMRRAKNGKDACPAACPSTEIGTAKSLLA